jgi:hypothetical protein
MTPLRVARRAVLTAGVCALLSLVLGTAGAAAQSESPSPWWGVSTGARPTNFGGANGQDEVQQLTVSATKGDVFVADPENPLGAFAIVAYNATADQLREAIETKVYLSRSVQVTGGPGDAGGTKPYVITFPGQAAPAPLVLGMTAELAEFLGEGEALEGEASLVELEAGAASQNQVIVSAENRGDAPTSGTSIVTDQLPAGLEAVAIEAKAGGPAVGEFELPPVHCVLRTLTCTSEGALPPYEAIEVRISVVVRAGAKEGEENSASAFGGGAAQPASASHALAIGAPQRFGIEDYELVPEQLGGAIDTQAGSHPLQLTSVVTFNTQTPDRHGLPRTAALPKDVVAELPPGLLGNPTPFAQCTDAQFANTHFPEGGTQGTLINECPEQSAIGVASVTFNESLETGLATARAPIFNMVPRAGEPARFGFIVAGTVSAFLDASVRSGGDYGVTISANNIDQAAWPLSVKLTFWGVPGGPVHDHERGWTCLQQIAPCPATSPVSPPPFLVLPSACGPISSTIHADSWATGAKPSVQADPITYRLPEAIDGCNQLPFEPSLNITPDGSAASTPTGLNVDVHVPQDAVLNANSLAESAVRDITVTLPQGVAVNPAGADGLSACSEALVGYRASESGPDHLLFTPTLPQPVQEGVNFCPDAAKIASAKITTPILPDPLVGSVYLASQNENPFGSLIAMYIVAQDPVSGVLVKLPGEVKLSDSGQIAATFKNSPQAPFENAEVHFFGGDRAPLATPSHCGSYTTNATLTPWAANGDANANSHFDITTGPHGSPCPPDPLPFSPSLTGGTTNNQAGAFTPLTTTISREDGNQDIQVVRLKMPPGFAGMIASVTPCAEAQANAGTCGPESLIGHTIVSVGLGGNPFSVTGGQVFLTGPYEGAPFGLSILNPAKAGPFDLGKVIVRAKVDIDPHTAQVSVSTDSSGPYAIPHILQGIPLQIKHVNVTIDRPGFAFNPTNCSHLGIDGTIQSTQGATAPVAVPFQVANCATLKFAPKLQISTNGKTSKTNGASLTAKLSYPKKAPQGTQTNIAKVKVALPKQLPSRLTTLQKACLAATFQANPARCPSQSIIGHATVHTPLLPVPLTGPAYFISHGGEAYPSLTILLQGDNVTIELVGSTLIRKGITSTTFKSTPDVPFSTFELTLPQGPYSALTANTNLCKTKKLIMPTDFTAQNGAQIHQNTKIKVKNCHRKRHHRQHHKRHRKSTHSSSPTKGKRHA